MYDNGFNPDSQDQGPGWGAGPEGGFQGFSDFGFDPFEAIFGAMNGFGRSRQGRTTARNVQYNYDINVCNCYNYHSIAHYFYGSY